MTSVDSNMLHVSGGSLYYETRGSGPLVLMISGGPTDADVFGGVADALADRYTVITYDTRGNSRSTIDGERQDQGVEAESEDAHRLLSALTQEPAFVFGNSGGALVGLELLTRHPHQVRMLVAHEPPLTELLPDAATHRARALDLRESLRRDGVQVAMMKFVGGAGLSHDSSRQAADAAPPAPSEGMARFFANAQFFLGHRIVPFSAYRPNLDALRLVSPKLCVVAGKESVGQLAHAGSVALAEQLGMELVQFPGDHGGFVSQPTEFADYLDGVFHTRGEAWARGMRPIVMPRSSLIK